MAEYRILLSEFKTGAVLAELPASDLQFRSVLSAPGAGRVQVPLTARPLEGLDWSLISPWRTLVHVQRGPLILWAGPLVSWDVDMASEVMTMDLIGLWGYYRRCIINRESPRSEVGYVVNQLGQHVIARELIQLYGDNSAERGGSYWRSNGPDALTFDPDQADGKLRDRTYLWYDWKNLGEAVEQLAAVIDGFDFRIDHRRPGTGRIVNDFVFLPQGGTPTTFILEHGVNCDVTRVTSSGDQMCSETGVNGAGEGWGQLKSWWYNGALESEAGRRIPRLAAIETHNSVTEYNTAAAHAWRMAAVGQTPMVVPELRLHPGGDVSAGNLRVGHIVRVRARLASWPGVEGDYIVQEIDTRVTGSGEETTLSLVPVSIYKRVEGLEPGDGDPGASRKE
ncbi:hypothetical protein ACWCYY_18285 [Kitasatospora sp. NPDC001664]